MRLSRASLGLKLNLALLAFFLVLGVATAILLLYGFNRTQDNATSTSQAGLEQFGSKTLGAFARLVSDGTGISYLHATESAQIGAQYLLDARDNPVSNWDPSVLESNADGVRYDPTEGRLADVWIPNFLQPTESVESRLRAAENLGPLFPGLLKNVPDSIAVYFVGADGELVYYPAIGVQDYLEPDVYLWDAAMFDSVLPDKNPDRKTLWVPPYDDLAQQGLLVSVLAPVYSGDDFLGAIGFDISLAAFVSQVDQTNPTANGYAFYIDSAGILLPSNHSQSIEESASEPENQALSEAMEAMRRGETGDVRANVDGVDVYVAYAPIPELGGSLALVAPIEDLLDEAQASAVTRSIQDEGDRTLRVTLIAMGGLFVLGLIGATYLNRRVLIRPLAAMVSATRALAQGDLEASIAVKGNDELAELGHSFNAMSQEVMASRGDLERQVEERTRELETLLRVSNDVASTLELAPLLDTIIAQVQDIAEYSRCTIYLVEGDSIVLANSMARPVNTPIALQFRLDAIQGPIWERFGRGEAAIIEDTKGDTPMAESYRHAAGNLTNTAFADVRAWLGVPLAVKDRIIGMLTLSHPEPGFFTERHSGLMTAIARQIAIAIENARLYEQAQQLAAVEERQRLARELHDSVSQALYGIALGARTARTLLDTDPARATEPVDYVLQLAEAGLAEMRALIFELRPESLEAEGLVAAIEKQIAATRARYGIDVEASLAKEPALTLAQKEAFYRVAQEALHNIVKHAHASRAEVRLTSDDGAVVLEVKDNGTGFDVSESFPGHMGLVSFTERATSIGARAEVESTPGAGTTVRLSLASHEAPVTSDGSARN